LIPVKDVIVYMEQDAARRVPPVGVYWMETVSDRRQAVRELRAEPSAAQIIPLLPGKGFDNANALLSDLVELLENERSEVEPLVTAAARDQKSVCLVLVSRTRLAEPIIDSPVRLPPWFAYAGGTVVSLDLLDIGSSASNTLQSQSELVRRLQVELYEIEGLMLARLTRTQEKNKNEANALFDVLLSRGSTSGNQRVDPAAFLLAAAERHARSTASGFRPVASPAVSELLGRVIGTVGDRAPNQLPKLAKTLFSALQISDERATHIREPLVALAFRSTLREFESDKALRCMRNSLLALYCASQLVTASAHAGEYGEFEVIVMRATIMDCAATLAGFKAALD
jgi:hypothetical protein